MSNFSTDSTKTGKRALLKRVHHTKDLSIDGYLQQYCGLEYSSHDELARLCLELWLENAILKDTISDFQNAVQAVADMKIVGGDRD